MWTEFFGEVREGWDGEVWEELGWLFEEGLHGQVEGVEVGIWRACHFSPVVIESGYRSSMSGVK